MERIPSHPGELIKYECLESLGLSLADGANALGIAKERLAAVVEEREGVKPRSS